MYNIDKIFILHMAEANDRNSNINNIYNYFEYDKQVEVFWTCKKPVYSLFVNEIKTLHTEAYDGYLEQNPNIYNSVFDCVFNHYQIMKISLLRGYKKILVLEDDCEFILNKDQLQVIINNTPEDASFLKLYHSSEENTNLPNFGNHTNLFIKDTERLWSTLAYIATENGMHQYIELFENNQIMPADLMFFYIYNIYINQIKMVKHNYSNKSYII